VHTIGCVNFSEVAQFKMSTTEDKEQTHTLPNGKTITVTELVNLYKDIQRTSIPTGAELAVENGRARSCRVQWSSGDFDRIETVKYVTNCLLNYDDNNQLMSVAELPGLLESNTELTAVTSESGRYRISLTKSNGKENKDGSTGSSNQRLNIWNLHENRIIHSIDVDSTKHGAICLDERLASLSFSPDESKLIYVAEKKLKSESYFKDANLFNDETKKDDTKNEVSKGNEYEYKEEWGEQLVGLKHTCVCILTLKPELKMKIVELPDQTLAQPFWIDAQTIGFIAFQEKPRRLGLVYCYNRLNYLYKCRLAAKEEEKDDFKMVRGENDDLHLIGAKINSQRDKVVWFENQAGGPHLQAQRLMLWNLKTDTINVVFGDCEEKQPIVKSLFSISPTNYWSLDGEHFLFVTINHSKRIVCAINVNDKQISVIDTGLEDVEILDLKNDLLVIANSSPNQPPVVKLGLLDFKQKSQKLVEFKQLRDKFTSKDDTISYRIIKQNENKLLEQVETIVTGPAENFDKPHPAIIIPHGGPHSASLAMYSKNLAFFVRLGFKIVQINYRGSLGITDKYVNQLCGNIGEMDISDMVSSINNLIKMNLIDKNNLHLFGGSHGGFIVCHLIGQYPDMFASCTALNPVTDISKKLTVSDIPDWSLIETFGVDVEVFKKINNWPDENSLIKQLNRIIDVGPPEVLKAMFDKSPAKHIDKVKTPVLMILGEIDKRVPHYQGLSFVNALKVRNIETKCYVYQDNHSIGKPANNGDLMINTARWLLNNLKRR